jgi:hypothetical protein
MSASSNESPCCGGRVVAVLVGLFATWQLVSLPAGNLIDFVPRRMGPPLEPLSDTYQQEGTFTSIEALQTAADRAGDVLDFWGEVSGQEQGWAMFAPGVPPYAVVPAAELRFADGSTETLLSPYEPADKRNPAVRIPLLNNRPFNAESQLMFLVWLAPPEEVAERYTTPENVAQLPKVYRALPEEVRKFRGLIRAYLSWRLRTYAAAHPDRPAPVEVVLKHRFFPSPKPDERHDGWGPVVERPFARWRPGDDSIEAYDVIEKRFVPVGVKP